MPNSMSGGTGNDARRRRATNSGVTLTSVDASRILGMYVRGDRQHDIASYHRVDSARVSEVIHEHKFRGVSPMPPSRLPPPGPYTLLERACPEQLKAALVKAQASSGSEVVETK
jgi:hypothetical protein